MTQLGIFLIPAVMLAVAALCGYGMWRLIEADPAVGILVLLVTTNAAWLMLGVFLEQERTARRRLRAGRHRA